MIWRDDDIGRETPVADLARVDDLFQAARLRHTIAILAEGLDTRPDLVALIRARRMRPQLHAWRHEDLTQSAQARAELGQAVDLIEQLCGERPTILYPPWNRTNADVDAAAAALGLRVSAEKHSLGQFLRLNGAVHLDTVNFHYWAEGDVERLPRALAIAHAAARRRA